MEIAERRLVAALNALVAACCDAATGYRTAAERVVDARLRRLLRDFGRERRDFHAELRAEVLRLGGSPANGGTIRGALHRGWIRAAGAPDVLTECAFGEAEALRRYREVLERDLPPAIRALAERHYARIAEVRELVLDLARQGG